ncbi:MAG: efflux RND transporter periplasmic adaptor subunit [Bacteroidetes bacterium]|nr:efflux RND transporter periplasmic adaptor subunit [Bacteroidota bacterium]MBS1973603.1 efflux RND transporter periplasmic adaptor subunit [Bacteroidota bacterium]
MPDIKQQGRPHFKAWNLPIYVLFPLACLFLLQACGSDAERKVETKEKYVIPDSILRAIDIDTVQKCQLVVAVTLTGQVDFNQDNVRKIYPMISGNVQGIKAVLGDYVKQGDLLGVVSSSEMAGYSNDLINAETNLDVARKNLDKTKDMLKSGLAAVTDSLSAEAAYLQAKSELDRVHRVLKINGGNTQGEFEIRSPINGFIVEKNVNNNTVIRADNSNSMFTISDLKNVWVWANVYESNITAVKMGDVVSVSTLSYPGKIFKGRIDKIMNVLDPANKVMKVRVSLDNQGYLLKPQMFASVTVINHENKESLCISSKALIFDHSQYYVLIYNSKEDVRITPVQIISANGDKTYIASGLNEGDKIISSQAILIYDALNS